MNKILEQYCIPMSVCNGRYKKNYIVVRISSKSNAQFFPFKNIYRIQLCSDLRRHASNTGLTKFAKFYFFNRNSLSGKLFCPRVPKMYDIYLNKNSNLHAK